MTDQNLEQRLRDHYHALDPAVAPRHLGQRIEDALDRREGRWAFPGRVPALAAGLAAVLLVAAVIALRPGGFLSSTGTEPTPTPSPSTASASPGGSATPTPSVSPQEGSLPPVSSATWTTLDLKALPRGFDPASVVEWSGGYLAFGAATADTSPLPAWISAEGHRWSSLPDGTFGAASLVLAAPAPDGLVVVIQSISGATTAWHSTDGTTWTSSPAPALRLARDSDMAGGAGGVVGLLAETRNRLELSADGLTWQAVTLPGPPTAEIQGVAAFGTGFVAVGDAGGAASASPLAWWSADGLAWSAATVEAHPGDGFSTVYAGRSGLVAISSTATTPGLASFWTSSDGRTWSLATDPLGVWQQGAGSGSASGLFSGDGVRLLGYGIRADNQPTEYWTSFDGTSWTRLTLTGDTQAALGGQVTPSLLRDGILFAGDPGSWLGTAVTP